MNDHPPSPCPICDSTALRHAERLSQGWFFCPTMARCFLMQKDKVIRVALTQYRHLPTSQRVRPQ